jgi:NADH:ubiquinone oxidoreductase subunit 6 (subunit J)
LDAISHVRQFRRVWPVLSLAALGLAAELILLLYRGASANANAAISSATQITPVASANTEQISDLLFSRYFVAFELASVLLLAAIVGSVWMGQDRKSSSRPSQQRPQERRIPS